ncbi:MAG: SigE family RNA polymerase sigma factor [Jatrophihabitantaceae bacterium]
MGLARPGPEFDEFVRASSTDLLRIATLLTRNREDAEDLLQVALVRTAGRWAAAKDAPFAYSRRVIINLSKNRWREKSRRPHIVGDLSHVASHGAATTEWVDEQNAMSELISKLPLGQRKVLVLRYFEDLSVAETASILHCSEGTVKSQLSRPIARLRSLLLAQCPAPAEETNKC